LKTRHIFFAIVMVAILMAVYSFVFSEKDSVKASDALKKEIAELTEQRDSLQKELNDREAIIQKLQDDSIYIEKIARTKFGMTKKGEKAFQFE